MKIVKRKSPMKGRVVNYPLKRRILRAAAAISLSAGLPAVAFAQTCTEPSQAEQARTNAAVDAVVNQAIENRSFPGAVLGIAEKGCIALVREYGVSDIENRAPVTERTSFRIGSTTKLFTAVALLRLVDQGKLSLDDHLSKFIPDFPRGDEVTLRQLLNHTAGIANYFSPEDYSRVTRADWTTDQLVVHIAGLKKVYDFDPGTAWNYSNSGYILIGAVIEKTSGQSYGAFLKSEFFDPLGLHDIAVDDAGVILSGRAHGYDRSKDAPTGFRNADFISPSAAGPAGELRATAPDLLKWSAALFGGKVLKPASLAELTSPAKLKDGRLTSQGQIASNPSAPGAEYGLGLFLGKVEGRPMIGHGGAINGFNTWFETFPQEKVTIVLLTNASYDGAHKTAPDIVKAYFQAKTPTER